MADPTYDKNALKAYIDGAKRNISVLQQGIQREKETITLYMRYIRDLEEKERIQKGIKINAKELKNGK